MTVRSGSSFENTEVMVSCHPWASFDVSSTIWFALQVLTQALCDRIAAALPTSHDDLAACGLKEDVVSTYGQQILDAAKVRPSEAGRKFEGAQCQMRACAMQGAPRKCQPAQPNNPNSEGYWPGEPKHSTSSELNRCRGYAVHQGREGE